jgi:ATP-dependent Clp protease protease subunit
MAISKSAFRPKRGNVVFSIKERWIKLFGFINSDTVRWFSQFIYQTNLMNYQPITVFIDSPGGNTNATLIIYAMLATSIAPVITIAGSRANSGAFIIFQAGHKRLMFPDSLLTFHWSEFEIKKSCEINIIRLRAMMMNLLMTNERLYRIIASRSKLPMKTVKEFFAAGKILTAKEAKKYNLTDEIIDERKIAQKKFG